MNLSVLNEITKRYGPDLPLASTTILLCTHAKLPTSELINVLVTLGARVHYWPIEYSMDFDAVSQIATISNVKLITTEGTLLEVAASVDIIMEDGARVSKKIAEHNVNTKDNMFAIEQTTHGIAFQASLPSGTRSYPVIDVARSTLKTELECNIAAPESIICTLLARSQISLSGRGVMLVGYGRVGSGIARLCKEMGARVTVCDSDPVRRVIANGRGFAAIRVEELNLLLKRSEIVISATDGIHKPSIGIDEIFLLPDGAILVNAGSGLGAFSSELMEPTTIRAHRGEITITVHEDHVLCHIIKAGAEKKIKIYAHGEAINLKLSSGVAKEAIDSVFALMTIASIRQDVHGRDVVPLDTSIEEEVAQIIEGAPSYAEPRYVAAGETVEEPRPFGSVGPVGGKTSIVPQISLARATFRAKSETAGHFHAGADEIYIALEGSAKIRVWHTRSTDVDREYVIAAGDILGVPAGWSHHVSVLSDESFIAVVASAPPFSFWDQYFPNEEIRVDNRPIDG